MNLTALRGGLFSLLAEAGRGRCGGDREDPIEEELGRSLLRLVLDVLVGWSLIRLAPLRNNCTCETVNNIDPGLPRMRNHFVVKACEILEDVEV